MTTKRNPPTSCERCPQGLPKATHTPCCSAHGIRLCCRHYRRTHFVEMGWCCDIDALVRPNEPQPEVVAHGK